MRPPITVRVRLARGTILVCRLVITSLFFFCVMQTIEAESWMGQEDRATLEHPFMSLGRTWGDTLGAKNVSG